MLTPLCWVQASSKTSDSDSPHLATCLSCVLVPSCHFASCHLILTIMALVFLGGGALLTALSLQVPNKQTNTTNKQTQQTDKTSPTNEPAAQCNNPDPQQTPCQCCTLPSDGQETNKRNKQTQKQTNICS